MSQPLLKILLPRAIDFPLTYRNSLNLAINIGDLVKVPLGNSTSLGLVIALAVADEELAASKIKDIIEKYPDYSFAPDLLKFIDWVANYTMAEKGNILKMALSGFTKMLEGKKLEPKNRITPIFKKVALNQDQEIAVSSIEKDLFKKEFSVTLLDGVTGSGKTEVYFSVIEKIYKESDSQILVLLPEIILTTQFIKRFKDRFGFLPAEWHSGVTPAQKNKIWQNIITGKERIIVGARSALFLPYKNLSLIVIDEEHDNSYKQEEGVIYQGRDMAIVRANIEKIPVILASATPSIETYNNVLLGKYKCLQLLGRHEATMPDIEIIDMRKNKQFNSWISDELKEQIAENIKKEEQSLLFLNRRGYAPVSLCRNCGHKFGCKNCSGLLIKHDNPPRLLCHICGYLEKAVTTCPACVKENSIVACGPGVQRIEEEIKKLWPNSRIILLDSDHLSGKNKREGIIGKIIEGEYDIIIGTQITAKGHHFPKLTLVGIIDADIGLMGADLRAAEKCFQLLHQVSGRAGREKQQGKVLIQSYLPDSSVIKALSSGDRDDFLELELSNREMSLMPPFSRLVAIIISSKKEKAAEKLAHLIVQKSHAYFANQDIQVLGPVPAPIYIVRGNYRFRILVRSGLKVNIQKAIKSFLLGFKKPSSLSIKIDVDPYNFS